MKAIFIVSIHFPNLYVRDTESDCKNKKNIVNKRIMRVKNLISHNKTQQLFGNNFGQALIPSDYQEVTKFSVSLT